MKIGPKVRILGLLFVNVLFKREGGPASDILGKFCTNQDGERYLQKKNGRVCKKPPALSRRPGGGGRYMGRTQPSKLKLLDIYIFHIIQPSLGGRKKLFWIGSSHALRLSQAALRNKDIKNRFQNDTYVRPGATFTQLNIPWDKLKSLHAQDVVIFQLFGNDLCEKYIRIDRIPRKTIHLTKFSSQPNPFYRTSS